MRLVEEVYPGFWAGVVASYQQRIHDATKAVVERTHPNERLS